MRSIILRPLWLVTLLSALWLQMPGLMAAERKTILVLGDSLSAAYGIGVEDGWVSLLERKLGDPARFQVVNASVSGETSSGGLARLPALLRVHQPELVIVELGGNDGLRGQPVARLRSNLTRIIERSRDAGARVLLLGMRIPPNYGPRYTEAFSASFADVAQATDVALVPFFLEGVATDPTLMQNDGIHPTAGAQDRMLDNVWPTLAPLLE